MSVVCACAGPAALRGLNHYYLINRQRVWLTSSVPFSVQTANLSNAVQYIRTQQCLKSIYRLLKIHNFM